MAEIFNNFRAIYGLKVNPQKSRALYSTGVPRGKVKKLTSITSIINCTSLDKYLGFHMLKGRVKKADFNFILDKIHGRLSVWENRLLNMVRQITLAKSVRISIPHLLHDDSLAPSSHLSPN